MHIQCVVETEGRESPCLSVCFPMLSCRGGHFSLLLSFNVFCLIGWWRCFFELLSVTSVRHPLPFPDTLRDPFAPFLTGCLAGTTCKPTFQDAIFKVGAGKRGDLFDPLGLSCPHSTLLRWLARGRGAQNKQNFEHWTLFVGIVFLW